MWGVVSGSSVAEVCSVIKVRSRLDAVVIIAASQDHMADERNHRPTACTQPFLWW